MVAELHIKQPSPGKVNCVNCGFLTLRHATESSGFAEAPQAVRVKPGNDAYISGGFIPLPLCFVRAADLWEKIRAKTGSDMLLSPLYPKEVLERDRDCKPFTPWQQGFTPKEHREMMDREKLLQWQRDERKGRETHEAAMLTIQQKGLFWLKISIVVAAFFVVLAAFIQGGAALLSTRTEKSNNRLEIVIVTPEPPPQSPP